MSICPNGGWYPGRSPFLPTLPSVLPVPTPVAEVVDARIADSLINTLQLYIVSDLVDSTLNEEVAVLPSCMPTFPGGYGCGQSGVPLLGHQFIGDCSGYPLLDIVPFNPCSVFPGLSPWATTVAAPLIL